MEQASYSYNPWPIGKVPEHLQRPELKQLKELGYKFEDPREVVDLFENKIASFAGSKYAVVVDSCTHAIELSLKYLLHIHEIQVGQVIEIPSQTYISIAILLKRMGFDVELTNEKWQGQYQIGTTRVYDSAVLWKRGMYLGHFQLQCVSFQIKKRIPIGRGGVILTNDYNAYEFLKLACYDGRDLKTPYDSENHMKMMGWHYYMTPEDSARGIILMDNIKEEGITGDYTKYPDIKTMLKNVQW